MSSLDDLESLIKENKSKRLRNKNSYMDEFLERRKQAANFALEKRISSGYNYTKPIYYINNGKVVQTNQKQKKYISNQIEDKKEFYKTYNTLKKNLSRKSDSINNFIFIEKENNKYYLSQGFPKNQNYNYSHNYRTLNHHHCCGCCKYKNCYSDHQNNNIYGHSSKTYYREEGLNDDFLVNQDLSKNKIYKNIKHHSIDLSSKNKNDRGHKNINSKNEIIYKTETKNLKNEKSQKTKYNYYDKSKNKSASLNNKNNNKEYFKQEKNQKSYNTSNINNKKYKSVQNTTTNLLNSIKIKEINKNKNVNSSGNIYYEGYDNHNFYDSNKMSYYKYNYETYKPKDIISKKNEELQKYYSKNLSEPKTFERNKNMYIIKAKKNILNSDNKKNNKIDENQIKDISPIRTYVRYYCEDNNDDFQGIEKIYDSQIMNGNSLNNSNKMVKYNIKLNNNYSSNKKNLDNKEKGIRTKSADLLHFHSTEIVKNTPNTKTISIVYKSETNKKNAPINNINILNEREIKNKKEIIEIKKDLNKNDILKNNKNDNNIINKDEGNKNLKEDICSSNKIDNNLECKKDHKDIIENENQSNNNKINNNIIKSENIEDNKNIKEIDNTKNNIKSENDIKNENEKDFKVEENKDKENNNIVNNVKENNQKVEVKEDIINQEISPENKTKGNNVLENKKISVNNNNNKESNNITNDIKNENNIKIENNINIIDENNKEEYPEIVDHEQNYEIIKEKYESFLRQKDDKEPNFQSKIMNSMLTSKDDSNLINTRINLIKNIKEKIHILKNNNKNTKQNLNYSNEIDDYFTKIKQKEEKNNLVLNEYYQELLNKERQVNTEDNKNIIANQNKVLNKEIEGKNMEKKVIIQRSNRLQNMMKNILYKKKYNNYNTLPIKTSSSKIHKSEGNEFREMTLKNNFNNIKLSKYNNAPNINLIVDENYGENIKFFDEKEYTTLKKKNIKTYRPINFMTKKIKESNQKFPSYKDRFDSFGFYNTNHKFIFNNKLDDKYITSFSPRIIFQDSNNKIMPANEIY